MTLGNLQVEALSHIISAQNYFQIPTPCLSPIYTPTPHLSIDLHHSPYHHHQTAFITQPSINMSNDLRSVFKDPSDLKMEDLTKPKCTLKLSQSFQSLKSIQHEQCPIMALPIEPQPTPMIPTVVSQPTSNDIAITPIIPTNPLFPPCL